MILILGEAWGEDEERQQAPFVGRAGWHLNNLLEAAGIVRRECFLTNVFNLRPKPKNDIENLCGAKKDDVLPLPPLSNGKYIRREFQGELVRLEREINLARPNLILALGGTALWATTGQSRITAYRGCTLESTRAVLPGLNSFKVLPAFHPAALLRDMSMQEITILDFMKAKRESAYPEVRRPQRFVAIDPTLADISSLYHSHFAPAEEISVDIETIGDQITCIGFAPSEDFALVVPFWDFRKPKNNYWPTIGEEIEAWNWVRAILRLPARKVYQNGLYDLRFTWDRYGIPVNNCEDDTMLMQHALHPELPKGLGFLGSVFTDEAPWKLMRGRVKTIKREE